MLVKSLFAVTLAALALAAPADHTVDAEVGLEADGELVDASDAFEMEARDGEGGLDSRGWYCPRNYPVLCAGKKCIPNNTNCCANGNYCKKGYRCVKCPNRTGCCPIGKACRC